MSGETGLDLGFTTEQEQIRDTARGFATRALTREFLREIDASGRAPHELLPQMAALGFNGLSVPVEHGGVGGSDGRRRAVATSGPRPVRFSTLPPAVTISPSTAAVPAWTTSAPVAASSSPEITSPEDDDSG